MGPKENRKSCLYWQHWHPKHAARALDRFSTVLWITVHALVRIIVTRIHYIIIPMMRHAGQMWVILWSTLSILHIVYWALPSGWNMIEKHAVDYASKRSMAAYRRIKSINIDDFCPHLRPVSIIHAKVRPSSKSGEYNWLISIWKLRSIECSSSLIRCEIWDEMRGTWLLQLVAWLCRINVHTKHDAESWKFW